MDPSNLINFKLFSPLPTTHSEEVPPPPNSVAYGRWANCDVVRVSLEYIIVSAIPRSGAWDVWDTRSVQTLPQAHPTFVFLISDYQWYQESVVCRILLFWRTRELRWRRHSAIQLVGGCKADAALGIAFSSSSRTKNGMATDRSCVQLFNKFVLVQSTRLPSVGGARPAAGTSPWLDWLEQSRVLSSPLLPYAPLLSAFHSNKMKQMASFCVAAILVVRK